MKFVIVESPFATNTITLADGKSYQATEGWNVKYARACLHDCLVNHGEAPYASHLLYTQEGILDDDVPEERKLGITAGLEIGKKADLRVFYLDRGFSSGMQWGLRSALELGQECVVRRLGGIWEVGYDPELDLDTMIKLVRG
jgi:hypothetical protein